MLNSILLISAGLVLLTFGAEYLVRGSVAIARRLRMSPLVIGLTVVAFGTSVPELVVSLQAALKGSGDIAVGNVIGSNIANIGLILGLTALVRPPAVAAKLFRLDVPVMVAASILFIVLFKLDGTIHRWEGALMFGCLIVYVVTLLRISRKESQLVKHEFEEGVPSPHMGLGLAILLVAVSLGALIFGSRLLVSGAVTIAQSLGVSEAVIGLTIVAVGTSLPELAASLAAAVRGHSDIAIGNVVGSNVFNVLCIAGGAGMVHPLSGPDIGWTDLGVMLGFAVLLGPLMRTGFRLSRWEGAVLLAGYAAYIAILVG